ncbi:MAG: mannose-phosphate guanylyltransferase [Actinomycetota bacterium]|nr:mannose-phosphate guanylyltransferase [Actinomycetota bacterium]
MLAAGAGERLRPLTLLRPKALCPVGGVPLVDHAVDRARAVTPSVAVNCHRSQPTLAAHLHALQVHVSMEDGERLGTAGALGRLRSWIDGRPVLVLNADTWTTADLGPFVSGWDGVRPRLLCVTDPELATWGDLAYAGTALLPWSLVRNLPDTPSGLWEVSWRHLTPGVDLDLVVTDAPVVDCGTPARYLRANLAWSGGESVIGEGAVVEGEVVRSVVWDGARVVPGERLVDAIRASDRVTVQVGPPGPPPAG